jgi:hypothetical protein
MSDNIEVYSIPARHRKTENLLIIIAYYYFIVKPREKNEAVAFTLIKQNT